MTRDAALTALSAVRTRVDRAGENLRDLDGHPSYKLLVTSQWGPVTAMARDVLAAEVGFLWTGYLALTDYLVLLDRMDDGWLSWPGRRARLARELQGPVVAVSLGAIDAPARALTGEADLVTRYCVEDLLAAMTGSFERVSATVTSLERICMTCLPAVTASVDSLASASGLARSSLIPVPAFARALAASLAALADECRSDPLSVDAGYVVDLVDKAEAAAGDLRVAASTRKTMDSRVAALSGAVGELRDITTETQTALRSARDSFAISDADRQEVDDFARRVDGLGRSAGRITDQAGVDWAATDRRVRELELTVGQLGLQGRHLLRRILGLRDQRDELRGRLAAYRAKTSALGLSEDGQLDVAHRSAVAELYTRGCDLQKAAALVLEYREVLDAVARSPR